MNFKAIGSLYGRLTELCSR